MVELSGDEVKRFFENQFITRAKDRKFDKKIIIIENPYDKSAASYAKSKKKILESFNIPYEIESLPEVYDNEYLLKKIIRFNEDLSVTGIFLQMPLGKNIDQRLIIDSIDPSKDIEGITSASLGKIMIGDETIVPPTAMSIISILEFYKIPIESANTVIINRSLIIGKPLIFLLLKRNATVTICHTKTKEIEKHIKEADIVISGVGRAHFFDNKELKRDGTLIDASINFENGKMIGDFCPQNLNQELYNNFKYTPVPGGVGVVTNIMLIRNILNAFEL